MSNSATQPDTSSAGEHGSRRPPYALALVLIWCNETPERIGELLLPPPGNPGPWRVFGRGGPRPEDSQPRLELRRDRPGGAEPTAALVSPRLSREQFLLRSCGDECIEVTNLGQAKLLHDDVEGMTARVGPNSTLQVGSQLLFLCIRRPAWMPVLGPDNTLHPFGETDAHGIVGESAAAWSIRHQIGFVAPLAGHLLLTGASGTGKELIARAVHARSPRRRHALVSRNAATLPETLVDAELFGNMKGYPNPGMPERPGLVGQAEGSTLFLDEIGELPEAAQAHLLRLLDAGEYQRLGDARVLHADVRFIAATNQSKALRHDFIPRFSLRFELPDLNARREDIALIARSLANRLAALQPETWRRFLAEDRPDEPRFAPSFVRALALHDYATNVRELEALLWESVGFSCEGRLECPPSLVAKSSTSAKRGGVGSRTNPVDPKNLEPALIKSCLDEHEGSIELSWRALGLSSRHVLVRLMKKHGVRAR